VGAVLAYLAFPPGISGKFHLLVDVIGTLQSRGVL
jgi:hypothetical protein